MRIAPKDTLLGHSTLKVREVIRMAMKEQLSAYKKEDIVEFISDKLALSIPVGKKLFRDLISEGYLQVKNQKFRDKNFWVVQETEKGRRFGNYIEELDWPRREVLMHLSTRKKGLSMHIEGDDEILKRVDLKIVYQSEAS